MLTIHIFDLHYIKAYNTCIAAAMPFLSLCSLSFSNSAISSSSSSCKALMRTALASSSFLLSSSCCLRSWKSNYNFVYIFKSYYNDQAKRYFCNKLGTNFFVRIAYILIKNYKANSLSPTIFPFLITSTKYEQNLIQSWFIIRVTMYQFQRIFII